MKAKDVRKGICSEMERIVQQMEVLDPSTDEYKQLSERLISLYDAVNEDGQNTTKLKSVILDNVGGFIGVILSMTLSIVLGQIPSPHAGLFGKMKFKH